MSTFLLQLILRCLRLNPIINRDKILIVDTYNNSDFV